MIIRLGCPHEQKREVWRQVEHRRNDGHLSGKTLTLTSHALCAVPRAHAIVAHRASQDLMQ